MAIKKKGTAKATPKKKSKKKYFPQKGNQKS